MKPHKRGCKFYAIVLQLSCVTEGHSHKMSYSGQKSVYTRWCMTVVFCDAIAKSLHPSYEVLSTHFYLPIKYFFNSGITKSC